jgi:hypothetical protein
MDRKLRDELEKLVIAADGFHYDSAASFLRDLLAKEGYQSELSETILDLNSLASPPYWWVIKMGLTNTSLTVSDVAYWMFKQKGFFDLTVVQQIIKNSTADS